MKGPASSSPAQAYLDTVSPFGSAFTPEESFRFQVLYVAEHPGLFGQQASASPGARVPLSPTSRLNRAP